jgi:Transposase domain (DUF772)
MMTNTKNREEQINRTLSSDLSRCLGERGLLQVVLDAVQTVDTAGLTQQRRKTPDFRPQMMLTLLTYCYSTSFYGSHDIEWAIERDRTVRYICARTYPDAQALRSFRRRHRELLLQCLTYVVKQVWALKFDEGEADYVGYEWFESELINRVNTAAWDRLDIAVLMDGVESDY